MSENYFSDLNQKQFQPVQPQTPATENSVTSQPAPTVWQGTEEKMINKLSESDQQAADAVQPANNVPQAQSGIGRYLKSFGEVIGMKFPQDQVWENMTPEERARYSGQAFGRTVAKFVVAAPRAIATLPVRVGEALYTPMKAGFKKGNIPTFDELAKTPDTKLPIVGNVPSFWSTIEENKQAYGPIAGTLISTFGYVGDAAGAAATVEGMASMAKAKFSKFNTGKKIASPAPDGSTVPLPSPSPDGPTSNYHNLTPDYTAKFGGNTKNTFAKFTPVDVFGDDSVEFAVVRRSPNGVETKLYSEVIKTKQGTFDKVFETKVPKAQVPQPDIFHGTSPEALAKIKSEGFVVGKNSVFGEGASFTDSAKTRSLYGDSVLPINSKDFNFKTLNTVQEQQAYIESMGAKNLSEALRKEGVYDGAIITNPSKDIGNTYFVTNVEKLNNLIKNPIANTPPTVSVLPAPLKGFENAPITNEQIGNLKQVVKMAKVDPAVAKALMRNVTGKEIIGDLTQTEYTKFAKEITRFKDTVDLSTGDPLYNPFADALSPRRNFFRSVQNRYGDVVQEGVGTVPRIPIYEKGYVPIEEAFQLRDIAFDKSLNNAQEIFGEYNAPKFAQERRLITSYVEGNKGAILDNPLLSPQVKSDLVSIADKLDTALYQTGLKNGIPEEVMAKYKGKYQTHIQDLGGVFQLYKDEKFPSIKKAFVRQKRSGSLGIRVDDARALWDIYNRTLLNEKYIKPTLETAKTSVYDKIPDQHFKASFRSYVQEKMGYGGPVEKFMNNVAGKVGEYFGKDVPPDLARQFTQVIMDGTYTATLAARPDAITRNLLQGLMGYVRMGPEFFGTGLAKALTKEGRAIVGEKGFLTELGVPYGQELAREVTTGGAVKNMYRKVTQGALKYTYSWTDDITRSAVYHQWENKWNGAMNDLKTGKIDMQGFEKKLDFQAFNIADQNILRQKIAQGDFEGALNHSTRELIDETNFPFRTGAGPRAFYGLGGKTVGQFGTWPVEFAHMVGRWTKTGQFDKLIRLAGVIRLTTETFKNLGMDISKWQGLSQAIPTPSPLVGAASDLYALVSAVKNQDISGIEQNRDALVRQLKSTMFPGIAVSRVQNFADALARSKKYPGLAPGEYGSFDSRGRLQYKTDFGGLFWGTLLGFPIEQKAETVNVTQQMRNEAFKQQKIKQQIGQLYRDSNFEGAAKLIAENGVKWTAQDMDNSFRSTLQAVYDQMPANKKYLFTGKVMQLMYGVGGGEGL